jgi:hypothetical protein
MRPKRNVLELVELLGHIPERYSGNCSNAMPWTFPQPSRVGAMSGADPTHGSALVPFLQLRLTANIGSLDATCTAGYFGSVCQWTADL